MKVPLIGIALAALALVAVTGPRLLERDRAPAADGGPVHEGAAWQAALAALDALEGQVARLQRSRPSRVPPADVQALAHLRVQLRRLEAELDTLSHRADGQTHGDGEKPRQPDSGEAHASAYAQ